MGKTGDIEKSSVTNRLNQDQRKVLWGQVCLFQCQAGRSNDGDVRKKACGNVVETVVPSRLDASRWSRFHSYVVTALGITWIPYGLEVTLIGRKAQVSI